MTELEKIAYAKSFIDKLANGINPLNDTPIPDDDIANNVRLSRCFFYVSDILRQVIDNGGITSAPIPKNKKISKKPFVLSLEQIEKFEFSQTPISATVLAKKINRLTEDETMERISYRHINQWLLNIGMLEYKEVGQGKKKRHPTADGEAMGIVLSFWGGYISSYSDLNPNFCYKSLRDSYFKTIKLSEFFSNSDFLVPLLVFYTH